MQVDTAMEAALHAVFVHDHRFSIRDGHVYSDNFPYSTWKRYLACFDSLKVVGRTAPGGTAFALSSGERVEFELVDGVSSLRSLLFPDHRLRQKIVAEIEASDLVIVRLPSELGLLAASVAHRIGKPCLVEVVGCVWDAAWNYGSLRAKAYAPMAFLRMRRAVARAPYASYVSEKFLQRRYPPARAARTLSASNVEISLPSDAVVAARTGRTEQTGRPIVVGLIGSLRTRYKGVHTAIEALAKMSSREPDLVLRVLGGGDPAPYRALAKRLGVADRVHFDGSLPPGGPVLEWLDRVDVYIQPSFQEGVPRALIEAMSRGCPALGSSAGGIPELLEADNVFPPGDVGALARMLAARVGDFGWLEAQARRNYLEASRYDSKILNSRRTKFFSLMRSRLVPTNVGDALPETSL